jgi:hypothetical protein
MSKVDAVETSVKSQEGLTPQLEKLEALRAQVDEYEKGASFYLAWMGTDVANQRKEAVKAAKRLYFKAWQETFFRLAVHELEMGRHHKVKFDCTHSDHINAETAIIMLANKTDKKDTDFLAEQFTKVFAQMLIEWKINPDFSKILSQQTRYCLQQLGNKQYVPYIKMKEISPASAKQQTQAPAMPRSTAQR